MPFKQFYIILVKIDSGLIVICILVDIFPAVNRAVLPVYLHKLLIVWTVMIQVEMILFALSIIMIALLLVPVIRKRFDLIGVREQV